jgi:hypothetical protein
MALDIDRRRRNFSPGLAFRPDRASTDGEPLWADARPIDAGIDQQHHQGHQQDRQPKGAHEDVVALAIQLLNSLALDATGRREGGVQGAVQVTSPADAGLAVPSMNRAVAACHESHIGGTADRSRTLPL